MHKVTYYRNIHVHTYVHVITSNEKRGHGFEKEQGKVYVRMWREEREGDK